MRAVLALAGMALAGYFFPNVSWFVFVAGLYPALWFIFAWGGKAGARDRAGRDMKAEQYRRALGHYEHWEARRQRAFWEGLTPQQFAQELAALFRAAGDDAHVAPQGNGAPRDIIIQEDGKYTLCQCPVDDRPADAPVAQALCDAVSRTQAHNGILVSCAGFTDEARAFVKGKPIRLMSVDDVLRIHHWAQ